MSIASRTVLECMDDQISEARSDATRFMRELQEERVKTTDLRSQLSAAQAVLREVEWAGSDSDNERACCPCCGGWENGPCEWAGKFVGHAPDCRLAAARGSK